MARRTYWAAMLCIVGLLAGGQGALGVGAQGDVLYVDVDATGTNAGTSWTDAYTDLQAALTVAESGDEIWVAEGTYKPALPASRGATFQLENGVGIYGGFDGTETARSQRRWIAHETILSGDIGILSDVTDNTYTVITSTSNDSTAVLDGFTVTKGNADADPGDPFIVPEYCGGGMFNHYSSPTVSNCTFNANSAGGSGGGMMNHYSSPALINCTFDSNTADFGAGVYNYHSYNSPSVTNCTFIGNSAGEVGGGMYNYYSSSPTLTNCTFFSNSARNGGGMYNVYSSSPTLTDCTFSNNSAVSDGGGMHNYYSSSPTLTDCTFSNNSAGADGGGMSNESSWGFNPTGCSPALTNCTFSNNSARIGGGMYNYHDASSTLSNCTFSGNSAVSYGGGIYNTDSSPVMGATVVANNTAPSGPDIYGAVTSEEYNLVENPVDCTGLVATDLTGVDPQLGPLADNGGSTLTHALLVGSPAIDAVPTSAFPSITTDQRGVARPQGSSCDIGAYEVSVPGPEMDVSGLGNSIPDGASSPLLTNDTDFGSVIEAGGTNANTFTITNSGDMILDLTTSPRVTIGGTNAADFILTTDAATSVSSGGGTTTFTVTFNPSAIGERTATISIANNDSNENPYNFPIQGTGTATAAPEMDVSGLGNSIPDGASSPLLTNDTDFGSVIEAEGTNANTFTITNSGDTILDLTTSPRVTIGGTNAADFILTTDAATSVSSGGGTTTFTVTFNPSAIGERTATISIANNDSNENPYNFPIQGTGTTTLMGDVDADGKVDVLDVRICLQIALGVIDGTAAQREQADFDGDGDVDLEDAIALAEYIIEAGS